MSFINPFVLGKLVWVTYVGIVMLRIGFEMSKEGGA